ncbi:hypothetical protein V6N13_020287 [Hibiscus sabdariffa]
MGESEGSGDGLKMDNAQSNSQWVLQCGKRWWFGSGELGDSKLLVVASRVGVEQAGTIGARIAVGYCCRGCKRRVADKLASETIGAVSRDLVTWDQQKYWAVWALLGPAKKDNVK